MPEPSFLDLPLGEYLARAASDAPTPGGGSVCAATAALGIAMAEMAARFTLGRKKYADVAGEIDAALHVLGAARAAAARACDADAEAFCAVGAAYALPKEGEEQARRRDAAIQQALAKAAATPLALLRAVASATPLFARLAAIGNANLVSDTGVAAELCGASAAGAALNVRVNTRLMREASARAPLDGETESLAARIARDVAAARRAVAERLAFG